jgi:hypothetical protein
MLQITTKKPTTTAITMANTVKASKEASDMRRLGGASKSFGGLEADGTAGERPAAGVGWASPARTKQSHDPVASGQDRPPACQHATIASKSLDAGKTKVELARALDR